GTGSGPRRDCASRRGSGPSAGAGPTGAAPAAEPGGAIAVLWLPEHAPTNTGSFPMLSEDELRALDP
ncbi:hypothetical protein GTW66_19005, partial [Streptomyces sp. SID5473]